MEVTLKWLGPFRQPVETSQNLHGKHGVYAIEYKSKILYIGKAEASSLLPQAKTHSNSIVEYFRKTGNVPAYRSHLQVREFVDENCMIYIAVLSNNQLAMIDSVERCLIFSHQPPINKAHKDKYEGVHSIRIKHTGNPPKSFHTERVCVCEYAL